MRIKQKRKRRCLRCGTVLVSEGRQGCLNCLNQRWYLDGLFVYGSYDGILRRAVQVIKFEDGFRVARGISEIVDLSDIPAVDLVVPVPLSKRRLLRRGFNQSLLLAEGISRRLGVTTAVEMLLKVRENPPQSLLEGCRRLNNPRGAYLWVSGETAAERILLVDDVLTTGATLNECARVLKSVGAGEVYGFVLARSDGGV